jgi:hypothetical protein
MPYVIKVICPDGKPAWIMPAGSDRIRSVGPREQAEVFQTEGGARLAISSARPFGDTGFTFFIEKAD